MTDFAIDIRCVNTRKTRFGRRKNALISAVVGRQKNRLPRYRWIVEDLSLADTRFVQSLNGVNDALRAVVSPFVFFFSFLFFFLFFFFSFLFLFSGKTDRWWHRRRVVTSGFSATRQNGARSLLFFSLFFFPFIRFRVASYESLHRYCYSLFFPSLFFIFLT